MRVAMIAPPWLALPIKGYGGIELVVEGLVRELASKGVRVEVFGNSERRLPHIKIHSIYKKEQYKHIHKPVYESLPIIAAHMQFALNHIKTDGGFDIIHDHNGILGPQLLAWASKDPDIPPIVHTNHGPPFSSEASVQQGIPDNHLYWEQLSMNMGDVYLIGISDALMKPANASLKQHILPTVYNAVDPERLPFQVQKKNYFITLARFSRDKGQHIAAKLCSEKNLRLRMAGTVAGIDTNKKLLFELANPLSLYRSAPDFRYYSDSVFPYTLSHPKVTYSGNIGGTRKLKFLANAKALLFPIDWDEPFGMAVIEALACGTPVIAMKRGAMPEIIEHGVTGFLAKNEKEFGQYIDRIDEIDPRACRDSVEQRFTVKAMANAYLERYEEAIARSKKH